MLKTTNAGLTWKVSYHLLGPSIEFGDVCFTNATTGTLVGGNYYGTEGFIFRTTDGGDTWIKQTTGTTSFLTGVSFPDVNHGTSVGLNGEILHTSDGGITWLHQSNPLGSGDNIACVAFIDSNRGIAVGSYSSVGFVYRTIDGGTTWTAPLVDGIPINDVTFINSDTVIAVGENRILRSTDGGSSWSNATLPPFVYGGGEGVSFANETIGAIVGFGRILRTTDAGLNWVVSDTVPNWLHGVSFGSGSVGIAVGSKGGLLRTTDAGTSWLPLSHGSVANFRALSFTSPLVGIAVGDVYDIPNGKEDRIVKTTNGGSSWQSIHINGIQGNVVLNDVSYPNPDTAVVVGYDNISWNPLIWQSADGGASWTSQPPGSNQRLWGVSLSDGLHGTAVGYGGTIIGTTDGGTNWVQQTSGTIWDLSDVHFFNRSKGIAFGGFFANTPADSGIILRTTNGGAAWTAETTDVVPYQPSFIDSNTGFALGISVGGSYILRTSDGGGTWTRNVAPDSALLYDISFIDQNVGICGGYGGLTYFTRDGGATWLKQFAPISGYLSASKIVRSGTGAVAFAAGESGTIICAAISPLPPKTWTGAVDSAWNTTGNWSPSGVPTPGDSVIIPPSLTTPVAFQIQQQIAIGSLTIQSGATLTLTGSLGRFLVLGDVNVSGTLEVRAGAATDIVVGGNWNIQSGNSLAKGALLDVGFIAANSTVYLQGTGTFSKTFYNIVLDTASSMSSSGTVVVGHQCKLFGNVNLRSQDTLVIIYGTPEALTGEGKVSGGTIRRTILADVTRPYQFESASTFVKFDTSGRQPSSVTMTVLPDTDISNLGLNWRVIPSHVDTLTNTIIADSVTRFSKWAFGRPKMRLQGARNIDALLDTVPVIKRMYVIREDGFHQFRAQLALHYNQSEVPAGTPEDSLLLLEYDENERTASKVLKGWNMVSVPVIPKSYLRETLFQGASTTAFSYDPGTGYAKHDTLKNRLGYWIKFDSPQDIIMEGDPIPGDSMTVVAGWNMIGSISTPINITSISSDPPGIATSNFFSYRGTYVVSDSIKPGQAYWVKVNHAGTLMLNTSTASVPSNRIKIVPERELPPVPPEHDGSGSPGTLPKEFALAQNYPNPFNPVTTIRYQLPVASQVKLHIYNLLGQEVRTLVDEMEEAGYKRVEFNAGSLPSGVYFYKMTAGAFTDIRKMILIK